MIWFLSGSCNNVEIKAQLHYTNFWMSGEGSNL